MADTCRILSFVSLTAENILQFGGCHTNLQILTEMQREEGSVLYTLLCMLIHTVLYSGCIKHAVNGVYTVAAEISGLGLTGKCGLTV